MNDELRVLSKLRNIVQYHLGIEFSRNGDDLVTIEYNDLDNSELSKFIKKKQTNTT